MFNKRPYNPQQREQPKQESSKPKARFEKIAALWEGQKGFSGQLNPLAAHILGTSKIYLKQVEKTSEHAPDFELLLIFEEPSKDDEIPF